MKKCSIEPDDGYSYERDNNGHKPWEEWEKEREEYLERTWPGLFRMEVKE